jgi:adenosylcobinamide-phosphate synthase
MAAANIVGEALTQNHLDEARLNLKCLVSRDAMSLSSSLVAAAAIESVAENTTDSFIAPWMAFAIFGLPGAVAYRAINTLDSMIGHRGKYEYLGKAAARLDDIVNVVPARLSAFLLLLAGTIRGLQARVGWKTMRRDCALTASPNAGWTMGAMAGLLGARLEKVGHYCLGRKLREPDSIDIFRATDVAQLVGLLGILLTLVILAGRHAIFA